MSSSPVSCIPIRAQKEWNVMVRLLGYFKYYLNPWIKGTTMGSIEVTFNIKYKSVNSYIKTLQNPMRMDIRKKENQSTVSDEKQRMRPS